jgi:hypothetical protein
LLDLRNQRECGLETRSRELARPQQILGRNCSPARRNAEAGKGAKDDVRERREAVQDEREDPDVQDFLQKLRDDVILAAHRPEQASERDVDPDEDARKKGDVAA